MGNRGGAGRTWVRLLLAYQGGRGPGDPLAMINYGIGILPLVRELRNMHLRVMQTWYADDAGAGGNVLALQDHLEDLMMCGTPLGYLPEPTKIILVVSPKIIPQIEAYFRGMGLCVVTGSCYLGGFISEQAVETVWIEENVRNMTASMEVMDGVARRHPKIAYAGLKKYLQQEWAFVQIQSVAPGVGEAFHLVKEALHSSFLP